MHARGPPCATSADFNGDGVPDPSLCMATGASSLHPNFLMAVFASLVQTSGSSQGVLWDPATMEPLVRLFTFTARAAQGSPHFAMQCR